MNFGLLYLIHWHWNNLLARIKGHPITLWWAVLCCAGELSPPLMAPCASTLLALWNASLSCFPALAAVQREHTLSFLFPTANHFPLAAGVGPTLPFKRRTSSGQHGRGLLEQCRHQCWCLGGQAAQGAAGRGAVPLAAPGAAGHMQGVPESATLSRWQHSFPGEALDSENSHTENYAKI